LKKAHRAVGFLCLTFSVEYKEAVVLVSNRVV
jgi:hypothetical protein